MPATGTSVNRIGYARVSSFGQNLDSQMDALHEAGCEKIFTDRMTGSRLDRPGWDQMMTYLRPGDTLVVTELSRMRRSLLDLLETDAAKLGNARILYENSGKTAAEACAVAGVGRRTFFSYLAEFKKAHASGSEGAL